MSPIINSTNIEQVGANIIYQIMVETTPCGACVPVELGEGRFAKVFKAWQRSDGQDIRQVAMKVLHNTATYSHQDLFDKEIELLKELSATGKFNGVSILDVVRLGPMIMCSCGRIYHPFCPACGEHLLQRRESDNRKFPSLACPGPGCPYEVSAMDIEMQYKRLTSFPAKQCCKEGPLATEGTIINFIDRPAVIMELQQVRLDRVGEHRRAFFDLHAQPFLALAAGAGAPKFSSTKRRMATERTRLQRAMAIDRMMLLMQIAEAVTWLHQEMHIVHKDLTPDNVMVNFGAERVASGHNRSRESIRFQDMLDDVLTYPSFGVKVIDFGLADRGKLSHKWYEERDVNNAGIDKAPYFSPEALQRIQHLPPRMQIDAAQKRFLIPTEVWRSNLSVHEGDLVTFQWDLNHIHDLTITRIERGGDPSTRYAYFDGTPPPPAQQRQIQLILPLLEAHDIYSIGALFYYVMTEDHQQVQRLSGLVNAIQTRPCDLTAKALKRRHGDGYIAYRDALPIPDPYWRDRIMEVILRAMVRGRAESYSSSRSQRGPQAALDLLWETKRICRGIQEQMLSAARVRRFQAATVGVAAATMLSTLALSMVFKVGSGHSVPPPHPPAPVTPVATGPTPATKGSVSNEQTPSADKDRSQKTDLKGHLEPAKKDSQKGKVTSRWSPKKKSWPSAAHQLKLAGNSRGR